MNQAVFRRAFLLVEVNMPEEDRDVLLSLQEEIHGLPDVDEVPDGE